MSRPRRFQQRRETRFIDGEGVADRNFLDHLKRTYRDRQTKVSIQVGRNHARGKDGGDNISTALKAANSFCDGDYDKLFVLFDGDTFNSSCRDVFNKVRERIRKDYRACFPRDTDYSCIVFSPCIECMLLDIVSEQSFHTTAQCKSQFRRVFGKEAHQLTAQDWARLFPRDLLETKANQYPELKQLLNVFQDP